MINNKKTNLEQLQDSLIFGLLHVSKDINADFNLEAASELEIIRETGNDMETLECFWNALSFMGKSDENIYWKNKQGKYQKHCYMLGGEHAQNMFEKFVKRYPNITRALTIYHYS